MFRSWSIDFNLHWNDSNTPILRCTGLGLDLSSQREPDFPLHRSHTTKFSPFSKPVEAPARKKSFSSFRNYITKLHDDNLLKWFRDFKL